MLVKLLEYLLGLFKPKTKELNELEQIVKDHEKKLKEIKDEKMSNDDITDHFNK